MDESVRIRFLDSSDAYIFSLEESLDIPHDVNEVDISKVRISARRKKVSRVKDLEKSKSASKAWRTKKTSLMRGIKKFHRSTKGKRFHRKLGRLLATRNVRARDEWLVATNSLLTHLCIQGSYSSSIEEEAQVSLLIEEAPDRIYEFNLGVIKAQSSDSDIILEEFEDTLEFFSSLVDPDAELTENSNATEEGD